MNKTQLTRAARLWIMYVLLYWFNEEYIYTDLYDSIYTFTGIIGVIALIFTLIGIFSPPPTEPNTPPN